MDLNEEYSSCSEDAHSEVHRANGSRNEGRGEHSRESTTAGRESRTEFEKRVVSESRDVGSSSSDYRVRFNLSGERWAIWPRRCPRDSCS